MKLTKNKAQSAADEYKLAGYLTRQEAARKLGHVNPRVAEYKLGKPDKVIKIGGASIKMYHMSRVDAYIWKEVKCHT